MAELTAPARYEIITDCALYQTYPLAAGTYHSGAILSFKAAGLVGNCTSSETEGIAGMLTGHYSDGLKTDTRVVATNGAASVEVFRGRIWFKAASYDPSLLGVFVNFTDNATLVQSQPARVYKVRVYGTRSTGHVLIDLDHFR